jgi:hypothetical protein
METPMNTEIKPGDTVFLVKYAIGRKGEPQEAVVKRVSADGSVELNEWYGSYKLGRDIAVTRKDADNIILGLVAKKMGQVRKNLADLEKVYTSVSARYGAS